MAKQDKQRIGQQPTEKPVSKLDTLHDTWRVMKPFVHFSVKALQVIGHGLIFIVKNIPKPGNEKPTAKDKKVIRI